MRWNWQSCCCALSVSKSCFITTPPAIHSLSRRHHDRITSSSSSLRKSIINKHNVSITTTLVTAITTITTFITITLPDFGGWNNLSVIFTYTWVPYHPTQKKNNFVFETHQFSGVSFKRQNQETKKVIGTFKSPNLHHRLIAVKRTFALALEGAQQKGIHRGYPFSIGSSPVRLLKKKQKTFWTNEGIVIDRQTNKQTNKLNWETNCLTYNW